MPGLCTLVYAFHYLYRRFPTPLPWQNTFQVFATTATVGVSVVHLLTAAAPANVKKKRLNGANNKCKTLALARLRKKTTWPKKY